MAEFNYSSESIFESELDMLINPVNCKGVTKNELSKQFKTRFPRSQKNYEVTCKRTIMLPDATGRKRKFKALQPGDVLHYVDADYTKFDFPEGLTEEELNTEITSHIVNVVYLPVKNKPEKPVKTTDVQKSLRNLKKLLSKEEIKATVTKVGIPHLGGNAAENDALIREEFDSFDYEFVLFYSVE